MEHAYSQPAHASHRVSSDRSEGRSPLHAAATTGEVEEAFNLVAQGAPIDVTDAEGKNALHVAAERGRLDLVQYLVCQQANVNLIDRHGNTPLDYALVHRDDAVAQYLHDYGAELAVGATHPAEKREILRNMLADSPMPHIVNQQLIKLESRLGIRRVYSFPYRVSLAISNLCNASCSFCYYSNNSRGPVEFMTLSDVRKMNWLRYVTRLFFSGDIGDSLTNPEFLDILQYLSQSFPHLKLHLITNGIGLTERMVEALPGRLSMLNVSVNAARERTWQRIMRRRSGFQHILEMCAYLVQLKREQRQVPPHLQMSMVMVRDNIEELPEFIDLAHRIGATSVRVNDYRTQHHLGCKALDKKHSPYYSKESRDRVLAVAKAKAEEHDMILFSPAPFSAECSILRGRRSTTNCSNCWEPWRVCCLTYRPKPGAQREMQFCCVGFAPRIFYDKSNLTEGYFVRCLWNHPIAQYFRQTVNRDAQNAMCTFCHTADTQNPQCDEKMARIQEVLDPILTTVDETTDPDDLKKRMMLEIGPRRN